MHNISFYWDENRPLEFKLPEDWKVLQEAIPKYFPEISNLDDELKERLRNPLNSLSLKELCRDKNKVSIVVDDISRPTPADKILPQVLKEIESAGIDLQNVIIIPGLGVHREMTDVDMEKKVSKEVLGKVRWYNHKCRDKNELRYLGKTRRGTPVYVNKYVADADLVILVGTIEPHPQAGFGGGYKNILPGVASVNTIAYNHLLSADPVHFSRIGWDPEKNPMRIDIEEAGKMLKGTVFIINTVLNSELKIVKILTGDPISAHREGIKIARDIYEIKIPKEADIVITNSYPLDLDLRQSVKCLANVLFAAKENGLVIATMRCREGLGNVSFPNFKFSKNYNFVRLLSKVLLLLIKNINIGISVENRFFAYFALKAILRNKIFIYAPEMPKNIRERIPLFSGFDKFQDLINYINKLSPSKKDVLLFPYGGVTYPRVED